MLDEIGPASPRPDHARSGGYRARTQEGADPTTRYTVTRAFIAGADARVRRSISLLLAKTRGFEVVGEAADGQQAAEGVGMVRPDLVVMDIDLPGMSKAADAGEIARACPQASIVVLTTAAQAVLLAYLDAESGGEVGVKGDSLDDLLVAIRTLRSGEVLVYPPW